MQLEDAIRGRRTVKAFDPVPLERETLERIFELARWAPNHQLTQPWRFRVLGAGALEALERAAGPEAAAKLARAPTLVAASATQSGEPLQDQEDLLAAGCATYIVLLAAHSLGLAGYWRTPAVLRTTAGREACGVPDGERVLGLIHLGRGLGGGAQKPRAESRAFVTYLP